MAKLNILTLGSSKTYTNLVALGISSAVVDDVNKSITFTLAADGSQHTIHFDQPSDGQDGISVTGISDKGNGVFTLLLSDGSESDPIQTVKGEKGDKGDKLTFNDLSDIEKASLKGEPGVSPTITENADNTDKIYKLDIETVDGKFTTPNLKGADGQGGGGTVDAPIESISVNGVNVSPDENKNVDITVPSIEGLTKDADLATVAKSGDYEDLINKPTIPSLDGYAKTSEIPTKISELENDSNYLSSIPAEYVTETELEAKGYLTEHQDISGKVDKVEGKSLISDTEIARLASVDNYDDTAIKAEIAKKADATVIPNKVSELTNDSNYQTAEQVNSTVTTEIAKVVADAPEDLNTLKEMSDWIAGHENDASAMNSAISDNKTAITALQTGKADKSDIPTTVAELSDSADYAKKTDIPTTLPADGGNADTVNNHTVESDVPVDAKFTDTVYDDTNIKYGEIAGGKNLFNGNFIEEVLEAGKNYTDVKLIKEQNSIKDIKGITFAVFGAYLKKGNYTFSYTNNAYFSLNRVAIAGTDCVLAIESIRKSYTWTQNTDGWTYFGIEGDDSETGVTDTPFSITPDIQIEEGTQATAYEPYISSIKMLTDEVSVQSKSLSVIGKCKNLLNPTLQTTTQNGVTCTANGDGTYTINGTASLDVVLALESYKSYTGKEKFRLVGCPNGGGESKYYLAFRPYNAEENRKDIGSGVTFNDLSTSNKYAVAIIVLNGTTITNLTFKPMLVNLDEHPELSNITYDDFVPYTGDGETLTHDVADLRGSLNELSTYSTEETKVGTWIDGKPVYEKTIFSSFTNYITGEYSNFSFHLGNVNVISIDGMVNYDAAFPVPVNYYYDNPSGNNIQRISTFYSKNSGNIVTFLYSSSTADYVNANYFVTIRYTKTTD